MKLKFTSNGRKREFELFNSTDDNIDYMEVLRIISYELTCNRNRLFFCDSIAQHIEEYDHDDVESVEDFKNLWQIPAEANVIFNPNPENTEDTFFQVPDEILSDRNKIAKYCFENYCDEHYKTKFYIIKD